MIDKKAIESAAAKAFRKQLRWECIGLSNTPTDIKEREKAAIEYAVATAEMIEAYDELDRLVCP